jgi:ArsR family transcriptional regulator, arsenate/arsenite/antimonite-responsive transcriptional repressor
MTLDEHQQSGCCGDSEAASLAPMLAAISHPARIEILRYLAGCGCSCCKDVVGHLDLAQSTVSQHLKVLVEAGLVRFAPERQRSRYELDREALAGLSVSIAALLDSCCGPPVFGPMR